MKRAEGGQMALEAAVSFPVVRRGKVCDHIPQRCSDIDRKVSATSIVLHNGKGGVDNE